MALTKRAKEMLEALDIKPRSKQRKYYTDEQWNENAEFDPVTWRGCLPIHYEGGTYHVCFDRQTGTWFGVSESKITHHKVVVEWGCVDANDAAETARRLIDHKVIYEEVPKEVLEKTVQDRAKGGAPAARRANDGAV